MTIVGALLHRVLPLWLIRRVAEVTQPYMGCLRCGLLFPYVEHHTTDYTQGRGCLPLCQLCWQALSITERLPFYRQLWNTWERQDYRTWLDIAAAVRDGK